MKEKEEKLYQKCLRCGRQLKTEEAKKAGYGKICLKKIQHDKTKKLF